MAVTFLLRKMPVFIWGSNFFSLSTYFLNIAHVPQTNLDVGDVLTGRQTDKNPCPPGAYNLASVYILNMERILTILSYHATVFIFRLSCAGRCVYLEERSKWGQRGIEYQGWTRTLQYNPFISYVRNRRRPTKGKRLGQVHNTRDQEPSQIPGQYLVQITENKILFTSLSLFHLLILHYINNS